MQASQLNCAAPLTTSLEKSGPVRTVENELEGLKVRRVLIREESELDSCNNGFEKKKDNINGSKCTYYGRKAVNILENQVLLIEKGRYIRGL